MPRIGMPRWSSSSGNRGAPGSYTEAGPPDSTSAFGCRVQVGGQQLGEDAALADPPGDQLRVLAPEVEDEDLLGRGRLARARPAASRGPLDVDLGGVGPRLGDEPAGSRLRRAVGAHQLSATPTPADTAARPFEPMPTDCSDWSFLPSVWSAGAIITSARWKERMSSYPVVAIEVRSAPIRLKVPSFSCAGPRRICSIVPSCLVATRVPRGSDGWNVAIPQ